MKIENYHQPKSSFLSVEKDLSIIVNKILSNENLKKLLYYTRRDALRQPKLTEEQAASLFGRNIKLVPKITVDNEVLAYIIISFDDFVMDANNPEFRDNTISFDIICHFDQWALEGTQLRPYRIAGELDSMFDKQRFTGIGKLEFAGASQLILNDEFGGLSLFYTATHGEEDKKNPASPSDAEALAENFRNLIIT